MPTDYIYDIESYPNVFTLTTKNCDTGNFLVFVCSPWKNDSVPLRQWIAAMSTRADRMVGFNNYFYDYPVLHALLDTPLVLSGKEYAAVAHQETRRIFALPHDSRWKSAISDASQRVKQVDLYRVHHFDNKARSTGLKALEFAMRSESIGDLPFPPGEPLTEEQVKILVEYNRHDVEQTYNFYLKTLPMLELRDSLTDKYGRDFTNHNDTKIGKDYFIMRLEEDLGEQAVYQTIGTRRTPRQTKRTSIPLKNVILPYIRFTRPEFQAVLEWLKEQVITETKGTFTELPRDGMGALEQYCDMSGPKGTVKNLNCIVGEFRFDFGTGGIHGSVPPGIICSDSEHLIVSYDVKSYYPNLAIANNFYPLHLTDKFCEIYKDVYDQRKQHAKGTPENAMFKLALNGVYGDSNNKYSPFYDPQYTMSITVNGQLLLCMLAEQFIRIPGLTIIQINTDGLEVRIKRGQEKALAMLAESWEKLTGLELEKAIYEKMSIRDCNNYLSEYPGGKLKRKGAYEYNVQWHQNHSALIVPKAAEAYLVRGENIREFIESHQDMYDFFLMAKVNSTSRLELDGEKIQRISRYYMSKTGGELVKVMPPLKGKDTERRISMQAGKLVTVCNDTTHIDRDNLDIEWYIAEVHKLVDPLKGNR